MPTNSVITVKPSGGDYSSLATAEAGEQTNLVSADVQLDIECYAMNDTSAVVVDGWTFDATRYLRIVAPASERHDGKWNTSKYRLEATANFTALLDIREAYTVIEGLQVRNTGTNSTAAVRLANQCVVDACILRVDTVTSGYQCVTHDLLGSGESTKIRNSIVMGAGSGTGITSGFNQAAVVENCIAVGFVDGFSLSAASTATNCYSGNNSGSDYAGSGVKTTCASEDATGTSGLTGIPYSTSTFVSVTGGSEDYHLVSGSALIGAGTDLSATFTTDIDGNTRSAPWDIGADEFQGGGGGGFSAFLASVAQTQVIIGGGFYSF